MTKAEKLRQKAFDVQAGREKYEYDRKLKLALKEYGSYYGNVLMPELEKAASHGSTDYKYTFNEKIIHNFDLLAMLLEADGFQVDEPVWTQSEATGEFCLGMTTIRWGMS